MPQTFVPRGRYFEEFQVGDIVVTAGRTITEADVVMFAGLTGDYNQLHTDAEFARQSMFGQRVAHGLLGLSIALGMATRLGFIEGTVLAFRELTWKFSLPILIGDTIHVKATVSALKALPRLGGGSVTLDVQVINQQDKVVQRGEWVALMASKAK